MITKVPNDKAPGPDGFTALFYKKTWSIIKEGVLNPFNTFWELDTRSFNLINDTYMIPLRKKEQPEEIKDYRPLSLIHSFGKLITKCLARPLGTVLDSLVHCNKTTFIKGRCIQDNFRTIHLSCKAIHASRGPCVLLKIDIAKAFDSIAWNFLIVVLAHLGFGQRWRNWISSILSTASTKILLNGRPVWRICHSGGFARETPYR